jgi:hypothetical protein
VADFQNIWCVWLKHKISQKSKWEIMNTVSWNNTDKLLHMEKSWRILPVKIFVIVIDFIYICFYSSEKLNKLHVETNARLAALFCEMGNKHPSSLCYYSWVSLNCLHLSGKFLMLVFAPMNSLYFSHWPVILHFFKYLAVKWIV